MIVLGLSNAFESGASLTIDGKTVAAANEERFSRRKQDDAFPWRAIEYVLSMGGLKASEVDAVAYGWGREFDEHKLLGPLSKRMIRAVQEQPDCAELVETRVRVELERDQVRKDEMARVAAEQGWTSKLRVYDHHLSHAATAFLTSPFDRALCFTADARGDFRSATVHLGEGEKITELDWRSSFDSLGFYYSTITFILGMRPVRHEGKVTGLAAYGDPSKAIHVMREMIDFTDGNIYAKIGRMYKPFFTDPPPALKEALSGFSKEDIAAACQQHLEDVMLAYIRRFLKEQADAGAPVENICLAGGLFGNVKLNQRILALEGVDNVFVYPNMGDGGLSVGATLNFLSETGNRIQRPIADVYLGPSFSDEEIKKVLDAYNLTYRPFRDKVAETADLLARGKVVGWFQGRMEWGPRARGARSILVHPADKTVNDWLNKRLHRTEFMPFAPATIPALAARSFVGWRPDHIASHFMTICYDCTPEFKESAPATVHVDGTARPQVVPREQNPEYHDLIKAFHQKTGRSAIINTSFNDHEEPIVCSPEDAVQSFQKENVDCLAIGNWLVGEEG
ncbi:MAG: carbamoyltransferase C-terminal domain-containing protein [Deltaproteobacteria bacterium]|nr:carbamoyltransferase C-terminal domain-containing protein [Deltaproteobacteria bacterium]